MCALAEQINDEQKTKTKENSVTDIGIEAVPSSAELLADDYATEIIRSLSTGPKLGRDITGNCSGSRPTVYRRLNRLVEAGFVETEEVTTKDGHQCHQFSLVRTKVHVEIDESRIKMQLRSS
jgi:DNA-binding HxlR family transcriptional regulator